MKDNHKDKIIYKKQDVCTNTIVFADNFSGLLDEDIIWNIYIYV